MSSSDTGDWGMNTPAYFCLDNLGGTKPEYEEPIETFSTGISERPNTTAAARQRYDLQGRLTGKSHKGLQLVRMPNGSVRKIMVK